MENKMFSNFCYRKTFFLIINIKILFINKKMPNFPYTSAILVKGKVFKFISNLKI